MIKNIFEYINFFSGIGTVIALILSVYLFIWQKRVLKIKNISIFCDEFRSLKGNIIRKYFLKVSITSLFPSNVYLENAIILCVTNKGSPLYGPLCDINLELGAFYNNTLNIELPPPNSPITFEMWKGDILFITKDHGSFEFNPSKKFISDYNAYLNNKPVENTLKRVDYGNRQKICNNIAIPIKLKCYIYLFKIKNFLSKIKYKKKVN